MIRTSAHTLQKVFPNIQLGNKLSQPIYFKRYYSDSNVKETEKSEKGVFSRILTGDNKTSNGSLKEINEEDYNQLKTLNEQQKANFEELNDKYKRSLADMINLRQRMENEIEKTKVFSIQSFCKDLIEVGDTMHRAIQSVPDNLKTIAQTPSETPNNSTTLDANQILKNFCDLYQGLILTERELQKVFTKHGLCQISPKPNEKFDPHKHEALFEVPLHSPPTNSSDSGSKTAGTESSAGENKKSSDDHKPGAVAVVTKIGYQLRERTLRPALVGVYEKDK